MRSSRLQSGKRQRTGTGRRGNAGGIKRRNRQCQKDGSAVIPQTYEPGELVRFSGETYCTRTHDSLKISNGKWYWFSQNIGGRSALDYLVKVKEMSFPEAVKMLNGQAVQPICYEKPPPAPRKLLLPSLDTNTSKTEAYLKSRGIHPQIIAYCIQHGLLFQSENANDVIFVGYDTKGTRRYAALRSMTTDIKGEATGSDKHFSFATGCG